MSLLWVIFPNTLPPLIPLRVKICLKFHHESRAEFLAGMFLWEYLDFNPNPYLHKFTVTLLRSANSTDEAFELAWIDESVSLYDNPDASPSYNTISSYH